MAVRGAERDTDADWRELGDTQPYWGVLTHPDYRTENLTEAHVEAFYETGGQFIDGVLDQLERLTGARPSGTALDFGCGTGRLTEAMARHLPTTGYDISPGMLDRARERNGKGTYVGEMPAGPFGWINSFIVLQHIPTARGMALIEELLGKLAPGGMVSLHVTVWRDDHLIPPPPSGWRKLLRPLIETVRAQRLPRGTILMHDYDLSAVVRLLNRAGIEQMEMVSTDHGGHHGVIILGRSAQGAGA